MMDDQQNLGNLIMMDNEQQNMNNPLNGAQLLLRRRRRRVGKKRLSGAQRRKNKRAALKAKCVDGGPAQNTRTEEVVKVGIACHNYPTELITLEQLDLIRKYLASIVDNLSAEEFLPRLHTTLSQGCVIALCKDEQTAAWLTSFIPDCKPWEGARLKAIQTDELPIRVILWIPGPKVEDNVIFKRIQKQNSGVNPDSWHIWKCTDKQDGSSLDISMDKESLGKIKSQGWLLYCGAVYAFVGLPTHKMKKEQSD